MEPKPLTTPFENIALCFSGGGYRAASFSLGVLSYFNRLTFTEGSETKTLLSKVSYMSSASGGTIATAMYTVNNVEGKAFDVYYKRLFETLEGDKLLKDVLAILRDDDDEWNERKTKRRNLINAFAIAYDKLLFDRKTIKDVKLPNTITHLREVCFNTTEFYRGLLFRQTIKFGAPQDKNDKKFLFGNFVVNLNHEAAEKLKLADVLAASSCFPAGFEPIIFPDDFLYTDETLTAQYLIDNLNIRLQTSDINELKFLFGGLADEELKANRDILINKGDRTKLKYKKDHLPKIGLMDGGITDNLGLESLMKANQRRIDGNTILPPFDFMMTNDVSNPFMDAYNVPDESKSFIGRITFNWVITIFALMGIGGISSLIYAIYEASKVCAYILVLMGGILSFTSVIFFVVLIWASIYIRGSAKKTGGLNLQRNFGPDIVNKVLSNFRKTSVNVLIQMAKARLSSVLILNNDIFLKRVRQILSINFFEKAEWKYRIKGNRIYDLAFSNGYTKTNTESGPIDNLRIVAETAMSMATTLWFDEAESTKKHKQACIIACGQFTTCRNLIFYIHSLKGKDGPYNKLSPEYKKRLDELKDQLDKDYAEFIKDPFFLYNLLGNQYKIEEFENVQISQIPFPENFGPLIR